MTGLSGTEFMGAKSRVMSSQFSVTPEESSLLGEVSEPVEEFFC